MRDMGLLGAMSAGAGQYAGVQLASLMITTQAGKNLLAAIPIQTALRSSIATAIGGVGGGLFAGAIFSYGAYGLGYGTLEAANYNMIAGGTGLLIGSAAGWGAFALVTTYGTASTGTAIASLHGAAATSAGLAWFGGGSLAAGGGGTAVGATVLTGGVIVVAVAAAAGVTYVFYLRGDAQQSELLRSRIQIVSERLRVGDQPEWPSLKLGLSSNR